MADLFHPAKQENPARKIQAGKIQAGKIQIDTGQVDTGQVDTGQVDMRQIDTGQPARRILHCWLPRMATDRITRRQPVLASLPFAAVRHERGRRIAVAVNDAATRFNVRAGQSLADARSLCPSLTAIDADPAADSRLLHHLARWCTRYTPWVSLDPPQEDDPLTLFEGALVLDVSGCAHLAGGETALLADMTERLQTFGLASRCAIADTPGAAWAWARHGDPARPVVPEKAQKDWLKLLPAAALRLREADAETLMRLGIATVGDLIALPRAAVANRFQGAPAKKGDISSVLYRLDQALGAAPESVSPLPAPTDYSVRQHYAEPIGTPEGVAAAFERLLLALGRKLEAAGMGARQLEFTLIRADDTLDSARIGVSRPTRNPAHLARLFAPRLECLDPDPGVETVILTAVSADKFSTEQHEIQKVNKRNKADTLCDGKGRPPSVSAPARAFVPARESGLVGELIDRLSNRLGRDAITRALPCETALPETQTTYAPALEVPREVPANDPALDWSAWMTPDRLTGPALPVRLLETPEPLEQAFTPSHPSTQVTALSAAALPVTTRPPDRATWRRQPLTLTATEGPARRLGRWWHGETAIRDYWQVETAANGATDNPTGGATHRLWLYRDPAEGWAVHGVMG